MELEALAAKIEDYLKKKHKKKSLNKDQKLVAEEFAKTIFINKEKTEWPEAIQNITSETAIAASSERMEKLQAICEEHDLDLFSAALLNFGQISKQNV